MGRLSTVAQLKIQVRNHLSFLRFSVVLSQDRMLVSGAAYLEKMKSLYHTSGSLVIPTADQVTSLLSPLKNATI